MLHVSFKLSRDFPAYLVYRVFLDIFTFVNVMAERGEANNGCVRHQKLIFSKLSNVSLLI